MFSSTRPALPLAAALTSALSLGLVLAAQSPSLATEARASQITITVNPSTDLPPIARVGVAGRGLDPEYPYHVQQCAVVDDSTNEWACDPNTRVQIDPDEAGAFSTPLTVHKRFVGYRGTGEYIPFDCAHVQCAVSVSATDGQDFTTAPITFY